MQTADSGLFRPQPRPDVVRDLVRRSRVRLEALDDAALIDRLEDTVYSERKRLERSTVADIDRARLERLARAAVRGAKRERIDAALAMVAAWGDEIHGRFDERVYGFATRALPRALTGLLSAKPDRVRDWDLDPFARLRVSGDLETLRTLCGEATLILAPTHVSNLDSPLIGLALYQAGLPPFIYGAGLNLFSNPLMGWWLRRLGAYTVDRTKRARLYKETLKDYSVRALVTRHHSLFFPGGTRSRSGAIEDQLKKGLLGTGLVAWQEMIASGRADREVYVVPLTLTFQLCLEAETLIRDHLEEAGKQRYIITDDEFAQPGQVASFARRALALDSSVVAHFGEPLDLLGRPVSADARTRADQAVYRARYVTNAEGRVERDPQRDRCYTNRLEAALVHAYPRGSVLMPTHLTAWVAWQLLSEAREQNDPFRLVRVGRGGRRFPKRQFVERLRHWMQRVREGVEAERWQAELPSTATEVLDVALDRFARFHKTRALALERGDIVIEDPRLCLYYQNRALFLGQEA